MQPTTLILSLSRNYQFEPIIKSVLIMWLWIVFNSAWLDSTVASNGHYFNLKEWRLCTYTIKDVALYNHRTTKVKAAICSNPTWLLHLPLVSNFIGTFVCTIVIIASQRNCEMRNRCKIRCLKTKYYVSQVNKNYLYALPYKGIHVFPKSASNSSPPLIWKDTVKFFIKMMQKMAKIKIIVFLVYLN